MSGRRNGKRAGGWKAKKRTEETNNLTGTKANGRTVQLEDVSNNEVPVKYSPGIPPAVEAYLNSPTNDDGLIAEDGEQPLSDATKKNQDPDVQTTTNRDYFPSSSSRTSPGLVNSIIDRVGSRLNDGLHAVGVDIAFDPQTRNPTAATVAGMTLKVEDVRVAAEQVKETVKRRVDAAAVKGRELASATIATVSSIPGSFTNLQILQQYRMQTQLLPTDNADNGAVPNSLLNESNVPTTAHLQMNRSVGADSDRAPLKQRPPTFLKPYLNLLKTFLVSALNFVFMLCNLVGLGTVLGINEKTGMYAREVVHTVCDLPDTMVEHLSAVAMWATDLTKMWFAFWLDLAVYLASLPLSIAATVFSTCKKLFFTLVVAFLNRAPGGHEIKKALNGHIAGYT